MHALLSNSQTILNYLIDLFEHEKNTEMLQILKNSNLVIEEGQHDNWNGGIIGKIFYFKVNLPIYFKIKNRKEDFANLIAEEIKNITKHIEHEYLEEVHLIPKEKSKKNFDRVKEIIYNFDENYLINQIERIEKAIEEDVELAIGESKSLVESCCKTILKEMNVNYENLKLPELFKEVLKAMNLRREDISENVKSSENIKKILSSFSTIVEGITKIRNEHGTGHGKIAKTQVLKKRHAKLIAGASITLTEYLFEYYQEKIKKT